MLSHATLDDKDAIINMVFDYLPQSAPKFTHFLSELLKFLPMVKTDTAHIMSDTLLEAKGAGCVFAGKPLLFFIQNTVSSNTFLLR